MTEAACPFCGGAMVARHGTYVWWPGAPWTVTVKDADWSECADCGEAVLPPNLRRAAQNRLRHA